MSGTLLRTAAEYLQCSFRGIPFVVAGNGGTGGRRQADHAYPGRDGIWIEDMGQRERRYSIRGFVSGAFAYTQRDLLLNAAETEGNGLLVHPSIGTIKAALTHFGWRERDGQMNVVDLEFEFVEQKNYLSTLIVTALHAAVAVSEEAYALASSKTYVSNTKSAFAVGTSVESAARDVATSWASGITSAIASPRAMQAISEVLPGNNGRYFGTSGSEIDTTATEDSVLAGLTESRSSVAGAVSDLASYSDAGDIASGIQALTEMLRNALPDPAAQIALIWPLATCSAPDSDTTAPIGQAIATAQTETAALCRRAALSSLALASSDWSPASSSDALKMASQFSALFHAEQLIAGDAGDTEVWSALRDLGAQVATDLNKRAANLPDIVTINRNVPLPALTLAQQLYGDGSRFNQLVSRADPTHPAFMPVEFEALSS